MKAILKSALLAATIAAGFAAPSFAQDSVLLPNLSYRTGPFAVTGIPLMNGQADYMAMINERDGGANGVKLELSGVRDRLQHREGRRVLRKDQG